MTGQNFYLLSGFWALGILAVFISAIRLCYRVEARSEHLRNTTGIPFFAQMPQVVVNWGVARDPETQALRRAMNIRLLIVLAGFVLFAIGLNRAGAFD